MNQLADLIQSTADWLFVPVLVVKPLFSERWEFPAFCLLAVGLVVGAAGAISATRLLQAALFETNVYDPLTFATVPVVLGAVALAASYLPARRAAAVDPIVALRD